MRLSELNREATGGRVSEDRYPCVKGCSGEGILRKTGLHKEHLEVSFHWWLNFLILSLDVHVSRLSGGFQIISDFPSMVAVNR